MKNKIILVASAFFLGFSALSQTYTFSVGTNTYIELDNPTYLTPVGETWDDPEFGFDFPFVFEYFGVNLPALTASYGVGAELFGTNSNLQVPIFVPVFCDPIDLGYMSDNPLSSISYKVEGIIGNRILKVQWKNIGFFNQVDQGVTPLDYMNYQAWFYEGTNRIEIRFGASVINNPNDHFESQLGGPAVFLISTFDLITEQMGNTYYLTGNPINPTMNFTTDFDVLTSSSLSGIPANGQTYIFMPDAQSGLESEINNISFSIFPNPSSSILNIIGTNGIDIEEIQIYDISGRVMHTFYNQSHQLNIEDLNNGNYSIKISSSSGQYIEKFIKQ